MNQYIESLTNNLIAEHNFDEVCVRIANKSAFISHVAMTLEIGLVAKMNPKTLGFIMCSFEVGDVMASKQELFTLTTFAGDCGLFLRRLVSVFLAYAILHRLEPEQMDGVPFYRRSQKKGM